MIFEREINLSRKNVKIFSLKRKIKFFCTFQRFKVFIQKLLFYTFYPM